MNYYRFGQYDVYLINEAGKDEAFLPAKIINPQWHSGYNYSSIYSIKVLMREELISSVTIQGGGGATGIHENSSLIYSDKLLLLCGDTVFCLSLPDLELSWILRADDVTCFQIFPFQEDVIIHGEMYISRINAAGEIIWQFSGRDIFVNIDGEKEFEMREECICLTDFKGDQYRIDYNGREL